MASSRRAFLFGGAALIAAPAIVRAESLMKLFVPAKPAIITELYEWKEISVGYSVTIQDLVSSNNALLAHLMKRGRVKSFG